MKVAIVNALAPFIRGGAELLADELVVQMRKYGHECDLIKTYLDPSSEESLVDSVSFHRFLDLGDYDLIVPLKFPCYLIPHRNKVIWLLHQFRSVYDLSGTTYDYTQFFVDPERIPGFIKMVDEAAFREARAIYTNASIVGDRLMKFNGFRSSVLEPPVMHSERFHNAGYGDFILAAGRINSIKRQFLAVEAMAHCSPEVKLVLAGQPESISDESEIRHLIKKYKLQNRVTFLKGFMSLEEKIDLFSRCLAVVYLPYLEDSFGYVTAESFFAGKAVVTVSDSGGVTEWVKDGETGYVTEPKPEAIATAFDRIFADRAATERMGTSCHRFSQGLNTWEKTVHMLTGVQA